MISFSEVILAEAQGPSLSGRPLFRVMRDISVSFFGHPFHTIREGFLSDRTSFPKQVRLLFGWTPLMKKWLADPNGKYDAAAVFHDDLLENTTIPKWAVDLLYKAALRSSSVSAIEAWLFGSAVRIKRSR